MQEDSPDTSPAEADTGAPRTKVPTPLGKAMERHRLAAGQNVGPYCKARGIVRTTWYRLAYDHDNIPRETVVTQLAEAIGLDPEEALALREEGIDQKERRDRADGSDHSEAYATGSERTLTPLGVEMEAARIREGKGVTPFCAAHNIHRKTWYRLAYDVQVKPRGATVIQIAQAIGLNPARALRLAGLDHELTGDLSPVWLAADPAGDAVQQRGDNGDSSVQPE